MTNYEWLIKEKTDFVKELMAHGGRLAIVNGEPKRCSSTSCGGCEFANSICMDARMAWLEAEHNPYTIPLNTPIDTKVLVSGDEVNWIPRYFAGFGEDQGHPYLAFRDGVTSWTNKSEPHSWRYCKLADEPESEDAK